MSTTPPRSASPQMPAAHSIDPEKVVGTRSPSPASPNNRGDEASGTHTPVSENKQDDATKSPQRPPGPPGPGGDAIEYPSGKKLAVIMTGLYLTMFLVALDRTIIATAIPTITNEFHSLDQVGWYGSAYLITNCAFQLAFGRIYTFYSPKWVFMSSIMLFEIGSAICGAAPNSTAFIVGRAVAGLGSAGIFGGAMVIIFNTVPLRRRPAFTGSAGAIFALASVLGPLMGGAFTDRVTWRWCFYINLPVGAVTLVAIFFFLSLPAPVAAKTPLKQKILRLDPLGNAVFLPSIVCLLLVLQWGGSTYAWSDGRIIGLLVVFAVLFVAFVALQIVGKENATVPPRIIRKRSIAAGTFYTLCIASSMMIMVYFLPIYFQAIKGVSAVQSGIDTVPLVLALAVASMASGFAITRVGYYVPFMIASVAIMSAGAGLISTFAVDTGSPPWIGYQVLFGFGLGLGMQQANLAAQTVLDRKDIGTGAALMFFMQGLGGAVFISVGQNVFSQQLVAGLAGVPGLDDAAAVVRSGATEIRTVIPPDALGAVLERYNGALVRVFHVAVAMAALAAIGVAAMEWKSIKKEDKRQSAGPAPQQQQPPPPDEKQGPKDAAAKAAESV